MKAIEPLLDLLSHGGAGINRPMEWRLCWASWENATIGVRDRERAGVHTPLTLGRGFALDYLFQWEDGRITAGVAEKVGIAEPEAFLALARQTAFDDPDGANFAPPARFAEVPLFSDAVAREVRADGIRLMAPILQAAADRASTWKFATWSGSISASVTDRGVLTSRGLSTQVTSTQAAYSFWYEGRLGDGHSSREPIAPEEARERLDRACDLVSRLGTPESNFAPGTMPVLLHPNVVEALISTHILSNLHGDRILHGQSAFRIDQFGSPERIFAEALSLRLEPCVPMDVGSFRFTGEGVPARPVGYIEEGCLVEPILDLKYARRLGREPVPGPASADSLRLTAGEPTGETEAVKGIGRGVLVLSLLGLHTQDPTRGDFSVSAPQALAIRDGALGGGIKAVLTGNFFEALRDPALVLVAFDGFRMPGILYSGSVGIDRES